MEKIIKAAVDRGASDIHIKAGDVFRARVEGKLVPLTKQRLTPDQTKQIALQIIPVAADREAIDRLTDYDCSWGAAGVGRFRVNILRQRSSFMIVMRVIPFEVPTLNALGLPSGLGDLVVESTGLVLITGPSGSGRSSTMAAMLDHINSTQNRHIVMLESPIQYLHRDINSSMTQREVGTDTRDFARAVFATLHQDPDVVAVDRDLDPAILEPVLRVAETGHLALATLHTPTAEATIAMLASMAPHRQKDLGRARLAMSLRAIVSQRLVPRADGTGMVAACEILVATPEVRDMLRDRNRVGDLRGYMASQDSGLGTLSMSEHLNKMVEEGVISRDVADAEISAIES